ncbi:MAG TPA: SPOR domain-containing protein [Azospira sp.]|nr:SPOR domain-containing protein [Azospira sp.]
MRAFVFLLLLANLAFFAWTQGYFGQADNPDAARLGQQIASETLRVLSRDQPPGARGEAPPAPVEAPAVTNGNGGRESVAAAADAANVAASAATPSDKPVDKPVDTLAAAAKPVPEKCVAWGGLSTADADALEAALGNERFAALRRVRHSVPEIHSWWVFIPPLATRAEADKKAGELRRLGITEYFVVQDAGPNRHAISLGIFSSESAAEAHLNALRTKGVRSAKVGGRPGTREVSLTVEVSGPESLLDAVGEAVRSTLPAARAAACGKN